MSTRDGCPESPHREADRVHGFQIERIRSVPELRATVTLVRHASTGARLLHVHNEDRQNVFGITFRTPPSDSTGVAHILEHCVLAGSEKYPAKDVFNELSKNSLCTYLNALTAPDFTAYPIASQVRTDFYNLVDVYLDLTLHPLLKEETFMQEGHHLVVSEDGTLGISGVVFNEMKGAFSTAERVSAQTIQSGLFPDHVYGLVSGGHPEAIPDLTYEAFREFHRRFYTPANAFVLVYGDIPLADHLAFLAPRLERAAGTAADSTIPDLPRWGSPRRAADVYPAGDTADAKTASVVNVSWLTGRLADEDVRIGLGILDEVLLGSAGAPLRKALVESGLGQDVSPASGLKDWLNEMPFTVGLRGVDASRVGDVEAFIRDTLFDIARDGVSEELIEAAFHQTEFGGREIPSGGAPFGITLLLRVISTWINGGDPFASLTMPSKVAELRERWQRDPDMFTRLIRTWLLENAHCLVSCVTPSASAAAERDARLKSRLEETRARLSDAELTTIRDRAARLREHQRQADRPEALATLPKLQIEDVPRDIEHVSTTKRSIGGVPADVHDVLTNGIVYVDAAFDVGNVPEELLAYVPVLGYAITGMGAGSFGYDAFARRKARYVGRLSAETFTAPRVVDDGDVAQLLVHVRALPRNVETAIEILADAVLRTDFSDRDRLRAVLTERRNAFRAALAPNGHMFARRVAASGLSRAEHRQEAWDGLHQLKHLDRLVSAFDDEAEALIATLTELARHVVTRQGLTFNVTIESDGAPVLEALAAFAGAVPERPGYAPSASAENRPARLGVPLPGDVCYTSRVLSVPGYGSEVAPQLAVLSSHARAGVLYRNIRVEGGAYGGFSTYDPIFGRFALLSYRDPNLEQTFATYDRMVEDMLRDPLDADTIRAIVLSTAGRMDRPMSPRLKGLTAFRRSLLGVTDDMRQRYRDATLDVTAPQLERVARDVLAPALRAAPQAVLAPRDRIERANETLEPPFEWFEIET